MTDYSQEIDLARATVMDYLKGTVGANAERLTRAFYSSTNLHSLDDQGRDAIWQAYLQDNISRIQ